MSQGTRWVSLLLTTILMSTASGQDLESSAQLRALGAKISHDEAGNVVEIDIRNARLTKQLLSTLKDFQHLRVLTLHASTARDEDFAPLGDLRLEELYVSWVPVGKVALEQVCRIATLRKLNFSKTNVTDADLACLKRLPELEVLFLYQTSISDDGLTRLLPLKKLKRLHVATTKVSDAGLESIGKLPSLESLNVGGLTGVTSKGLATLQNRRSIKVLSLHCLSITAADLKHLVEFAALEELDLMGTNMTGAGFSHLKGLAKLERISLTGAWVSEQSCADLATLPALKKLDLSCTFISESAFGKLTNSKLQEIDLLYSRVSDRAVERLQEVNKGIRIKRK